MTKKNERLLFANLSFCLFWRRFAIFFVIFIAFKVKKEESVCNN